MLTSVGVSRVLTMDLHADQIQGFFDVPVDNIYAAPVLLGDVWKQGYETLIVVSPDVGGVVRARALAKRLESDLAIIDKRRPKANVSEVMNVIGEVKGRTCVIMDDMVDTAGTLCKAAEVLKAEGAKKVVAYCTHAVLSGNAVARIAESAIDELVVTDTIPLREDARAFNMHPYKGHVQHIDFQRVSKDKKIHMKVPLHFVNAELSPGVKEQGGIANHVLNELDVTCLPDDLPGFIQVDMGHLTIGHSVHVKDLTLPKGVEAVLHRGENPVVATIIQPVLITEEETTAAEAVPAADVPTTEQAAPDKAAEAAAGGDKTSPQGGDN